MDFIQIAESQGLVGKLRKIAYLCASVKIDAYENRSCLDEIFMSDFR
jgi:hypothetical protein